MIKCVECGKVIADGGPRYATPIGSFCCDCWDKKDQKYKDDMLKRTLYDLAVAENPSQLICLCSTMACACATGARK